MFFLYNSIIRFYGFNILIASFFNDKAKRWIDGRKDWNRKFSSVSFDYEKWIWFHCSSLGEFNDGKTVLDAVKQNYPHHKILLTFFSPSGYEAMKNRAGADMVLYMPLDTKRNAEYFLEKVKPVVIFFVRNDVWLNYVSAATKRGISVFLVSFSLSHESKFLKYPQRMLYKNLFAKFKYILTQNSSSEEILEQKLSLRNVIVAGNTRFDRVKNIAGEDFISQEIKNFIGNDFCMIAGSTLIRDRKLFIKTYRLMRNENIKWIIVPHEINRSELEEIKMEMKEEMICYSEIKDISAKAKVLCIDNVGMLAKMYRYADVVFIGGGFDKIGIHNIIEPAVYGCPVCFGPNYRNYSEASDLLNLNGAEIIRDETDLRDFILKYKNNPTLLLNMKQVNTNYVLNQTGATERILNYVREVI